MSFIRRVGKTKQVFYPMTTSTAMSANSLTTFASGLLVAATSATAATDLAGVLEKAIASTDSDYATTRSVKIEIPLQPFVLWEATYTASLVAADIGVEGDLTDSVTADRANAVKKLTRPISVISTTLGLCMVRIFGHY